MFIEPFKVEIWMNEWETRCTHNLAETCVASITIQELLSLAGLNESALSDLLPMKLTYGDIECFNFLVVCHMYKMKLKV